MADIDNVVQCPLKNVPSFMLDNAIEWHNEVSGDSWTTEYKNHPDIQHRIIQLCNFCDEYDVIDGKVVYTEQDLF